MIVVAELIESCFLLMSVFQILGDMPYYINPSMCNSRSDAV